MPLDAPLFSNPDMIKKTIKAKSGTKDNSTYQLVTERNSANIIRTNSHNSHRIRSFDTIKEEEER